MSAHAYRRRTIRASRGTTDIPDAMPIAGLFDTFREGYERARKRLGFTSGFNKRQHHRAYDRAAIKREDVT